MRIFIWASSSETISEKYKKDCETLIESVLRDNDLVFGAYEKGLMGISYRVAKKNNREITGICPKAYKDGLNSLLCDNIEIVNSIREATMKIYQNCDVIIILPWWFGSLYEFFTANYCKVCKEIKIPIVLYNSCGYYDKLLSFIGDMVRLNFVKENEKWNYYVANNVPEVLEYLENISN